MPRSSKARSYRLPDVPSTLTKPTTGYLFFSSILGFLPRLDIEHISAPPRHIVEAIKPNDVKGCKDRERRYPKHLDYRDIVNDARIPLSLRLLDNTVTSLYLSQEMNEVKPGTNKRIPKRRVRGTHKKVKPTPAPTVPFYEKHKYLVRDGWFQFPPAKKLTDMGFHDRILWNKITWEIIYIGEVVNCNFYREWYSTDVDAKYLIISYKEVFLSLWSLLCSRREQPTVVYRTKNRETKPFVTGTKSTVLTFLHRSNVSSIQNLTWQRLMPDSQPIYSHEYLARLES